jgi:curved DNA-binding protein CbpA
LEGPLPKLSVNDQDYYSVLGVAPEATPDEIKARFRYLAQAYHPDKFGSDGHRRVAEEDFKRINEAYQVLSDPLQRASFDQSRQSALPPPPDPVEDCRGATEEECHPAEEWPLRQQRNGILLRRLAWSVGALVLVGCGVWYWGFHVPAERARVQAIEQQQREQDDARIKAEQENAAKKAEAERKAEPARQATAHQPQVAVAAAFQDKLFVNSLGMKFVPVPGTKVLFSVWETRVKDCRLFAVQATSWGDRSWDNPAYAGQKVTPWENCPVVMLSWYDAQAFCKGLTDKERAEGRISARQSYRLPTDAEWSAAVGLNESQRGTPRDKDAKTLGVYPWGTQWPPPARTGNYADATAKRSFNKLPVIENYSDGYAAAAPVGSFTVNRHGIYDLGGNVWEWCEDFYDGQSGDRAMRGGSWYNRESRYLLSSSRYHLPPAHRFQSIGFRCVLGDNSSQ